MAATRLQDFGHIRDSFRSDLDEIIRNSIVLDEDSLHDSAFRVDFIGKWESLVDAIEQRADDFDIYSEFRYKDSLAQIHATISTLIENGFNDYAQKWLTVGTVMALDHQKSGIPFSYISESHQVIDGFLANIEEFGKVLDIVQQFETNNWNFYFQVSAQAFNDGVDLEKLAESFDDMVKIFGFELINGGYGLQLHPENREIPEKVKHIINSDLSKDEKCKYFEMYQVVQDLEGITTPRPTRYWWKKTRKLLKDAIKAKHNLHARPDATLNGFPLDKLERLLNSRTLSNYRSASPIWDLALGRLPQYPTDEKVRTYQPQDIERIVSNSVLELLGVGTRHKVVSTQELDSVFKYPHKDRDFERYIGSTTLAVERLGGLIPRTSHMFCRLDIKGEEPLPEGYGYNCYIQEKAIPLERYLMFLSEIGSKGIEHAVEIVRYLAQTRIEAFRQGTVLAADFIYNYGMLNGKVVLLDFCYVYENFEHKKEGFSDPNFTPGKDTTGPEQNMNKCGFSLYRTREDIRELLGDDATREYEEALGLDFDDDVDLSVENKEGIENYAKELGMQALFLNRWLGMQFMHRDPSEEDYVRIGEDIIKNPTGNAIMLMHRNRYNEQFKTIAMQQYERDYGKAEPVRSAPLIEGR